MGEVSRDDKTWRTKQVRRKREWAKERWYEAWVREAGEEGADSSSEMSRVIPNVGRPGRGGRVGVFTRYALNEILRTPD
jgi:hypothetical protein